MGAGTTYTIGELAQLASVTTRTIRYYVAQGLLPPPQGGGRAASYGDAHRHKLELIKLLKQEFLPLSEIKSLLDSLDDDAIRTLLTEKRQTPPPARETAKAYLQTLLNPQSESAPLLRQTVAKKAQRPSVPPSPVHLHESRVRRELSVQRAPDAAREDKPEESVEHLGPAATVWQRHVLHPDIELLIRHPPTDARLSARFGRFLADLRLLVERFGL